MFCSVYWRKQQIPFENSALLLNNENGLMHWRNPKNHNKYEQHQLLLLATFQAVYYQIVWQSVSVKAIVISAAHEYFSLKLICKLTFLDRDSGIEREKSFFRQKLTSAHF